MKFNKNTISKIIQAILIFILFYNSYLFQYIPIILFKININKITDATNIMLNLFANSLLLIILFFIYRKDLITEFKTFKNKLLDNIGIGFSYWFIGLNIMVISNVIINLVFKGGVASNEQAVQSMISTLPWLMLINAGLIAPFNEEIVFRKTLRDVFKNHKWLFATISFLFFGLAHVLGNTNTLTDWLFIIPYGALGGAFALAYYKTDSVFTSMTMHMFHNFTLTLLSILVF